MGFMTEPGTGTSRLEQDSRFAAPPRFDDFCRCSELRPRLAGRAELLQQGQKLPGRPD